jgi:L-2,4-diaminobutyric acid acetyltransferase
VPICIFRGSAISTNIHKQVSYKINNVRIEDGLDIYDLVRSCSSLDQNSNYLYLLLCSHFDKYTLTAKSNSNLIGFVSAYQHPKHIDTLFIWQIAVLPEYRKLGIASEMLARLIELASSDGLSYIEATVTPSNSASFNMFKKIANLYQTDLKKSVCFPKKLFINGHEEEILLRIGPIKTKRGERNENL